MPGRPRGTRNHPGHQAGGARAGAGRRKKDENAAPTTMGDAARATQLLKRLFPNVTSPLIGITFFTEDGSSHTILHEALKARDAEKKAKKANANQTTETNVAAGDFIPPPQDVILFDMDEANLDPSLQNPIPEPSISATEHSALPALAAYLQADTAPQLASYHSLAPEFRVDPAESEPDHLLPITVGSPARDVAPSLPINPELPRNAHQVIVKSLQDGLVCPQSFEGFKPNKVAGPYSFVPKGQDVPTSDTSAQPIVAKEHAIYGPVNPDALTRDLPVVCYFILYERLIPARPVIKRPKAEKGGSVEPGAADIDPDGKGRAPRSCVICQSFTCKGRGGRTHCPKYDPNDPAHVVPENRKYKRPADVHARLPKVKGKRSREEDEDTSIDGQGEILTTVPHTSNPSGPSSSALLEPGSFLSMFEADNGTSPLLDVSPDFQAILRQHHDSHQAPVSDEPSEFVSTAAAHLVAASSAPSSEPASKRTRVEI